MSASLRLPGATAWWWMGLALVACADPRTQGAFGPVLTGVERSAVGSTASGVTLTGGELLGRPTDHSVTLKAITDRAVESFVEYGTSSGSYTTSTSTNVASDGLIEATLDGLHANTRYYYRLRFRAEGVTDVFAARDEHTFVTQRARGETFTFDVQADSHQGFAAFYSDALYGITANNVLGDRPDFLIDLGDTISTDGTSETQSTVRQKYLDQRAVFAVSGHSSPAFLVLGNHENEEGWNLDDEGDDRAASLPILGANARKRYFANPVPDGFYTGNDEPVAELDGDHLRGDYYAFEWGNALFVAIDPYWYTLKKPFAGNLGGEKDDEQVGDRWDWTLGKQQYDWLVRTLATSSAPFKFVFAHHVTGGTSDYGRGGALGARFGEWGGYDPDGTTYAFDAHRPGWGKPIHDILVENGVTVFFHAHDHVFAREELDGVVYQECPQAANDDYGLGFDTNPEDYADAALFADSGHLRVTVSANDVSVQYVRAFLPGDGENGEVAVAYSVSACGSDGTACDGGACEAGRCVATQAGDPGAGGAPDDAEPENDAGSSAGGAAGEPNAEGGADSGGPMVAQAGTAPAGGGHAGRAPHAGGGTGDGTSVHAGNGNAGEPDGLVGTSGTGPGSALGGRAASENVPAGGDEPGAPAGGTDGAPPKHGPVASGCSCSVPARGAGSDAAFSLGFGVLLLSLRRRARHLCRRVTSMVPCSSCNERIAAGRPFRAKVEPNRAPEVPGRSAGGHRVDAPARARGWHPPHRLRRLSRSARRITQT